MTIYNSNGTVLLEVAVDDNSYRNRRIMGDNNITLYFSLAEHIEIPVGAYCVFEGERYTLERPENLKMKHSRYFEYTVTLDSPEAKAKIWKFRNTVDGRLKFSLTAKPKEHLQMFVDNMNRRDTGWTVGECIDGTEKLISYDHVYCYEALSLMASELETEFLIKGKQVSLCKVQYNRDNPLPLSYGRGNGFKSGVSRQNGGDTPPVEILYVQGGSDNIDVSKYGSAELLLPKGQTIGYDGEHFTGEEGFDANGARHYVVDEDGLSVRRSDRELSSLTEDSLDCSDIYPKRVGVVTSVVAVDEGKNFYDFVDSTIPPELNYEDCLIDGETMTVIFQSGMLAGREFDVKYYHEAKNGKAARRFEIVPQEIDGQTMPNKVFAPAEGNKYAIFHCTLPDAYIRNDSDRSGASWDMLREAVRYLYEHEELQFTFTGELDGLWAKKDWANIGGRIILGGYILFSDERFQKEGVPVRIVGIKDYINDPHSPVIELSNTPVSAGFTSTVKEIEAQEIVSNDNYRSSVQFTKRRYRDAQETISMLEDALLNNFTSSISPIAVKTMSLLVGDESLQFRFVNNRTAPVSVNHSITYDSGSKQLTADSGIVQHLTLGIKSLSSSHAVSEYRFWNVERFTSAQLLDGTKGYYLYIKADRDGDGAVFRLSETAIEMQGEAGYYHFLVGILNSEYDGERSFVSMYGFSEVLPGRVTTDKVVSGDGKSYFDMLANAMKLGDALDFNSNGDGRLRLKGTIVQNQGGDESPVGVYRGLYNQSYTYYNGDEVSYTVNGVTSTYRYVSSTPSKGNLPTDSVYWQVQAAGVKGDKGSDGANGSDGKDGVSIVWKGTYQSHPSNPQNGWAYYNSMEKKSFTYRDGAWYQMTVDGVDGANGKDGTDGLSIVWKGESSAPPSSPQKNWSYRDSDNGVVYIYNGSSWEVMTHDGSNGTDGAAGSDGLSVFITYHDSPAERQPSTPSGDGTTGGWHTTPTGTSVWLSQKVAKSSAEGSWGVPIRIKGTDGADGVDGKDGVSIVWKGTYQSHPSNPQNGWAYYNSMEKKSFTYRDGAWYQMTVDGVDGANGKDGTDGLSIVWKGESSAPPSSPQKNWSYRDSDNGVVYIYNGSSWEVMTHDGSNGTDGAAGSDGLSVFITYHDSPAERQPSTPSGDGTTGGWHTTPTGTSVWLSQKVAKSSAEGSWGVPIRIKGTDGADGVDGKDAYSPYIGTNGNWFFYDDASQEYKDSGRSATGDDGHSPYVGENGNWFEYNADTKQYEDTGVAAKGEKGDKGDQGEQGIQGLQGLQGEQGEQGIPGEPGKDGSDGKDGRTSYFHVKYAPVEAPAAEQMSETPDLYIGTYVDYTEEDSGDPSKYEWTRFRGYDGEQGIPGINGENGRTSYLHIKYSNDGGQTFASRTGLRLVSGKSLRLLSGGGFRLADDSIGEVAGEWIGTYVDYEPTDSSDVFRYKWAKVKGEQGDKGDKGDVGDYFEYRYAKNGSTTVPPTIAASALAPDGWSTEQPSVGSFEYLWMTVAKISGDGQSLLQNWSAPVRMTPKDGADGKPGSSPALVFRGDYDREATYYGNPSRVDAVRFNGAYYVTRVDAEAQAGVPAGTGFSGEDYPISEMELWNDFGSSFESVATGLLLAENANIAGWIFRNGRLESQTKDNQGNPMAFLNGVNGEMRLRGTMQLSTGYQGNISDKNVFYLPAITSAKNLTMGYEPEDIGKVCRLFNSSPYGGASYRIYVCAFGIVTNSTGGTTTDATIGSDKGMNYYVLVPPQATVELTCFELPKTFNGNTYEIVGRWDITNRFDSDNFKHETATGRFPRVLAIGTIGSSGVSGYFYDGRLLSAVFTFYGYEGNYTLTPKLSEDLPNGCSILATNLSAADALLRASIGSQVGIVCRSETKDYDSGYVTIEPQTASFIIFAPLWWYNMQ